MFNITVAVFFMRSLQSKIRHMRIELLFLFFFTFMFTLALYGNDEKSGFSLVDKLPENEEPSSWQEITTINEKVKILLFLFNNCESNYQKIKTWEGDYALRITGKQAEPQDLEDKQEISPRDAPLMTSQGHVRFKIDIQIDALNWEYVCHEIEILGSKQKPKLQPILLSFQHIFSSELSIRMPLEPVSGVRYKEIPGYVFDAQKVAHIRASGVYTPSPFSSISDPRYFFCFSHGKEWYKHWSTFEKVATGLQGERGEKLRERFTNEYKCFSSTEKKQQWYKIEQCPKNYGRYIEYVFSEQFNFNLTRKTFFDKNGHITSNSIWRYSKENNINIPALYATANPENHFEYTLNSSRLNKKIPKETFTCAGLNCSDNDIVLNDLEQKSMIFKDKKFVFLSNYGQSPDPLIFNNSQRQFGIFRIMLIIVGFALIALGIYLKIRRKRN